MGGAPSEPSTLQDVLRRAWAAGYKAWKKEFGRHKWSRGTIAMVGMYSNDVYDVTLDGIHRLYQLPGTYELAVLTPHGTDIPSCGRLVFYSNCLAYLHDAPAFALPGKPTKRCRTTPVDAGSSAKPETYWCNVNAAFEIIHSTRYAWQGYHFRWPGHNGPADLPLSRRYGCAATEIAFYAMAVRQWDPLAEFLSYYRVIESVGTGNGKTWLERNLARIATYDFGMLDMTNQGLLSGPAQRNVLNVYRRRATARLRVLSRRYGAAKIPRYLYNEVRCGITHSRQDPKVFDFGSIAAEIMKDIPVLKLAARVAIEDKADVTGVLLPAQPRLPRRHHPGLRPFRPV